jgi:bacterioferritin (cytochrome b1)
MLGWLQRALRHEFAASRQFTLQAVVARELGDSALACECEASASEELRHAQRFAAALAQAGAGFGDGAVASLPIGYSTAELIGHARATEAAAVRLYRDAARACQAVQALRRLFESIGAEEAAHYEQLTQRLRQAGQQVASFRA